MKWLLITRVFLARIKPANHGGGGAREHLQVLHAAILLGHKDGVVLSSDLLQGRENLLEDVSSFHTLHFVEGSNDWHVRGVLLSTFIIDQLAPLVAWAAIIGNFSRKSNTQVALAALTR